MISKIGNWVFGSFFRTIGRLLVFIVLGIIIAHFIDFGSIKDNFSITDLFLDKVKADSQTSAWWESYYTNQNKTTEFTYNSNYAQANLQATGTQVVVIDYWLGTNITKRANEDYIMFPIMITNERWISSTEYTTDSYCDLFQYTWNQQSNLEYYECISDRVSQNTHTVIKPLDIKFVVKLRAPGSSDAFCTIDGTMAKCYLRENTTYQAIRIEYTMNALPDGSNPKMSINRGISTYKDGITSVTDSINQQTQQQQQQHQQIMDSNMTETNETASNFFGSFTDSDTGGLSGIITAPLVMINKMLDGVCVQPSATWKGATISLPCGDFLWSRNGASDLKNLVNVFYGGFICYYAIRKLFLMIENLKDPTQDKIEVTDL